jgi:hypothetical protein
VIAVFVLSVNRLTVLFKSTGWFDGEDAAFREQLIVLRRKTNGRRSATLTRHVAVPIKAEFLLRRRGLKSAPTHPPARIIDLPAVLLRR